MFRVPHDANSRNRKLVSFEQVAGIVTSHGNQVLQPSTHTREPLLTGCVRVLRANSAAHRQLGKRNRDLRPRSIRCRQRKPPTLCFRFLPGAVCLHVGGTRHLLRESIKALEAKLDPNKFVRLHRSAIVNIDHVREIHRDGRTDGWILLSTGERVRLNRTGWQKLIAMNAV